MLSFKQFAERFALEDVAIHEATTCQMGGNPPPGVTRTRASCFGRMLVKTSGEKGVCKGLAMHYIHAASSYWPDE